MRSAIEDDIAVGRESSHALTRASASFFDEMARSCAGYDMYIIINRYQARLISAEIQYVAVRQEKFPNAISGLSERSEARAFPVSNGAGDPGPGSHRHVAEKQGQFLCF